MTPGSARFDRRDSGVPSTLAWLTDDPPTRCEGNILSSGATLAWTAETARPGRVSASWWSWPRRVPDSEGVILVPAFAGLGAPHWDREAPAAL